MAIDITEEVYLGDGLYASFDSYQWELRAPRESGECVVFLEPDVLEAFLKRVKLIQPKKWERINELS